MTLTRGCRTPSCTDSSRHSFQSDFPLMTNIDGKEGKNIKMPDGIRCIFTVGFWFVW